MSTDGPEFRPSGGSVFATFELLSGRFGSARTGVAVSCIWLGDEKSWLLRQKAFVLPVTGM
jgi:hypothetical protein